MNFVFLSPHFPPNYHRFAVRLKEHGVRVLGLADEPYDRLRPELQAALTEYYRVDDMHDYDGLLRALGYFTHRHGRIDRIDSHNEYWLETEARLRTDFNIPGLRSDSVRFVKRKSLMKQVFRQAGVAVAEGLVAHTLAEALALAGRTGYPLVAKPDVGVGAAATYRMTSEADLAAFFAKQPAVDYIFEQFIPGSIYTFDGITDQSGQAVFVSCMTYSTGVMDTILDDALVYYHTLLPADIPAGLIEAGQRVLAAFEVCERFFHFEFFRHAHSGEIVALEVNMRPPGGLTTDMMNFACDIDVYNGWASLVAGHGWPYPDYQHKFACCYAGRKHNRTYARSHEEVLSMLGPALCHHEPISGVFSAALGDHGYLFRAPGVVQVSDLARRVQE